MNNNKKNKKSSKTKAVLEMKNNKGEMVQGKVEIMKAHSKVKIMKAHSKVKIMKRMKKLRMKIILITKRLKR